MNNYNNSAISILYAISFSFILIAGVLFTPVLNINAQSTDDIVFPVSELGNCTDKLSCKSYCDDFSHANECISFAEKHKLMTKEEVTEARHFAGAGIGEGPGGCSDKKQCDTYCNNVTHIQECIAFGEKHGLIKDDELKEAKQIATALAGGAKMPGGCENKNECETYCEDVLHMEECLSFAEAAGFIDDDELKEARRVMPLMQKRESPGGCRSRAQCEVYCDDDSHFEECIVFAEKAGFIEAKDAEMARKTGGKGPGGCKRDECKTYCDNPAHQDECFAFAKEHGLISEDELREMERGMGEFQRALDESPPEVTECINGVLGADIIAKIKSGDGFPPRDAEPRIRECFEKMGARERDKFFDFIGDAPPEVVSCLLDKIGVRSIDDIKMDSPESGRIVENAVRGCFDEFGSSREDFMMDDEMMIDGFEGEFHDNDFRQIPGAENMIFDRIPPEAIGCVKEKFGGDFGEKVSSGSISQKDISSIASDCMRQIMENRAPNEGDFRTLNDNDFSGEFREFEQDKFIDRGFKPFEQFEKNEQEDFRNFEDNSIQEFDRKFDEGLNTSFEGEFQKQYEEQYRAEFEKRTLEIQNQFQSFESEPRDFESFHSPENSFDINHIEPQFSPEPTNNFIISPDSSFEEPTNFVPPLDGSTGEPTNFIPEGDFIGEPQSKINNNSLLGNILTVINQLIAH